MNRLLLIFVVLFQVGLHAQQTSVSDCFFIIPFGHGATFGTNTPAFLELGFAPSCANAGAISNVRLSLERMSDIVSPISIVGKETYMPLRNLHRPLVVGGNLTLLSHRTEHSRGPVVYSVLLTQSGNELVTPRYRLWLGENPPAGVPTVLAAQIVPTSGGGFEIQAAVRNWGEPGQITSTRLRILYDGFVGETIKAEARPAYIGSGNKVIRAIFPSGTGSVVGNVVVLLIDPDGYQVPWIIQRLPDTLLRR